MGDAGEEASLRVGYFLMAPLVMERPDGAAVGAAVSMFREIAGDMAVDTIVLNGYPLKRLLHSLREGALDAALALGKTPERAEIFAYPDQPFFHMRSTLVVRADHPLTSVRGPAELRGLQIAVFEDGFLSPLLRRSEWERVPLIDSDVIGRALAMVDAGRVDAFYHPERVSMEYQMHRKKWDHRLRLLPLPEPPTGLYTVFSREAAPRYLERYEAALRGRWRPDWVETHLRRALREGGGAGTAGPSVPNLDERAPPPVSSTPPDPSSKERP